MAVIALGEAAWHTAEGEYCVLDTDRNAAGGVDWKVQTPDGDHVLMSALAVATALNEAERAAAVALLPGVVEKSDDAWCGIPDHERWRSQRKASELTTVACGTPRGNVLDGSSNGYPVDPYYDPALVPTLEERIRRYSAQLKARGEKGSSVRAIKGQLRKLRENRGRASCLVHGSYGKRRDLAAQASPELKSVVRRYVLDRVDRETITQANLEADFKNHHGDLLDDMPEAVWKAALLQTARLFNLFEPAPTRRSKSIRTPERQGMWIANRPYESLQLDSTPLDLFGLDSNGRITKNLHLVWALDPFCSKVRALRIVGGGRAIHDAHRPPASHGHSHQALVGPAIRTR